MQKMTPTSLHSVHSEPLKHQPCQHQLPGLCSGLNSSNSCPPLPLPSQGSKPTYSSLSLACSLPTLPSAYTLSTPVNPAVLPSGDKLSNGELWLDHTQSENDNEVCIAKHPRECDCEGSLSCIKPHPQGGDKSVDCGEVARSNELVSLGTATSTVDVAVGTHAGEGVLDLVLDLNSTSTFSHQSVGMNLGCGGSPPFEGAAWGRGECAGRTK